MNSYDLSAAYDTTYITTTLLAPSPFFVWRNCNGKKLACKMIIDNNNNIIIVVSPRHNFETEFELTTQQLDNTMLLKKCADCANNEQMS